MPLYNDSGPFYFILHYNIFILLNGFKIKIKITNLHGWIAEEIQNKTQSKFTVFIIIVIMHLCQAMHLQNLFFCWIPEDQQLSWLSILFEPRVVIRRCDDIFSFFWCQQCVSCVEFLNSNNFSDFRSSWNYYWPLHGLEQYVDVHWCDGIAFFLFRCSLKLRLIDVGPQHYFNE